MGRKITDGAYATMIERITGNSNPDFFFMSYSREALRVHSLIMIPRHFFVPEIIEKRKPLSPGARRAGWVGCNIVFDRIPRQGVIEIIANGKIADKDGVVQRLRKCSQLATEDLSSRGWLMDTLSCMNSLPSDMFTLEDMYQFEGMLKAKHPQNNNIRAKIRQQLQLLRDKSYVQFLGRGKYLRIP